MMTSRPRGRDTTSCSLAPSLGEAWMAILYIGVFFLMKKKKTCTWIESG